MHRDITKNIRIKKYQNKGPIYQSTFKIIDKSLKSSYKKLGLEKNQIDLLCRDWDFDTPDIFYKSITMMAEEKAIKATRGHGKSYVNAMINKGADITTLQRLFCGPNASQMKVIITSYQNNMFVSERDFRNMFHEIAKFITEHRKVIDVMSLIVNKAIEVDKLYNDPIQVECTSITNNFDPLKNQVVLQMDDFDDEDDFDSLSSKSQMVEIVKKKFPAEEFNNLFTQSESHLVKSFNVREIANRLFTIYDNLYKTYLFYNQALDIQTYIENKLDKKYHITNVTVSPKTNRKLIEEGIEEGIKNNVIDIDF